MRKEAREELDSPEPQSRLQFAPSTRRGRRSPNSKAARAQRLASKGLIWLLGCIYQRQLIIIKRFARGSARTADSHGIECVTVDSLAALHAIAHEIPHDLRDSAAELEQRIASGCVVCFARLKRSDGPGHDIVGYELAERGVFSALGRRVRVDDDVVFSHWVEVRPAYRGLRIHGALFATRDAYFRERGCAMMCGVCRPNNRASLRALSRDRAEIFGVVERIVLFWRLELWRTPLAEVESKFAAARQLSCHFS